MGALKSCWGAKSVSVFLLLTCISIVVGIFVSGCDESSISLKIEKVAQANYDECFYGIGDQDNYFNHKNLSAEEIKQCTDTGGTLKKNNGYLWGLTKSGNSLWFGTCANMLSVTMGRTIQQIAKMTGIDITQVDLSNNCHSVVTELQKSAYRNGELGLLGDYRPPRIFTHDITTGTLTDKTPNDPLISSTFGLRSAATSGGVVFLAGPCMDSNLRGINMFAFNASTQKFIGSRNIRDIKDASGQYIAKDINNIRKWIVVNNILYTTVGTDTGGKVLRWTGSLSNPFQFNVVGSLDDQGTEIVYHENRLFILTWPPSQDFTGVSMDFYSDNVCDIMMTKNEIPKDGLKPGTEFVKVWSVNDYEPDKNIAPVYGLGAAASFDGYLYWGTMNVPFLPLISHVLNTREDTRWTPFSLTEAAIKTTRTTVVFRAKNFASGHPEIELLYGDEYLDAFEDGEWVKVPNNMHAVPLYGEPGFGNRRNAYVWSMNVFKNQLFMGTFDTTFPEWDDGLLRQANTLVNLLAGWHPGYQEADILGLLRTENSLAGADLIRFRDSLSPGEIVTNDCFGNHAGYGFRNMLVTDDAMYIGTAAAFNKNPNGAWELYKMTPQIANP